MGLPTTTASSISSARQNTTAGPVAPSLATKIKPTKSRFTKKLLLRATGLVALLSVLGISSAADQSNKNQASPNQESRKATTINLDNKSGETSQNTSNPAGDSVNKSTNNQSIVGGTTNKSNSSFNVKVNDQPIAVPENGSTEQVVTTPDGNITSLNW